MLFKTFVFNIVFKTLLLSLQKVFAHLHCLQILLCCKIYFQLKENVFFLLNAQPHFDKSSEAL